MATGGKNQTFGVDDYIGFAESLKERCHRLGSIHGIGKLERKIHAELKFLNTVKNRHHRAQPSHLHSSNLCHFASIVHATEGLPDVVSVLHPFRSPDRGQGSLVVDVVACQGHHWIKVIARKGQALHLVWAGQGQFGERDLLAQAEDYLQASHHNVHHFIPPKVHMVFYNQVTYPMAEALTSLGVTVWGQRVKVHEAIALKLTSVLTLDDSDEDDFDEDNDDDIDDSDYTDDGDDDGNGDDFHGKIKPTDPLHDAILKQRGRNDNLDNESPHSECVRHDTYHVPDSSLTPLQTDAFTQKPSNQSAPSHTSRIHLESDRPHDGTKDVCASSIHDELAYPTDITTAKDSGLNPLPSSNTRDATCFIQESTKPITTSHKNNDRLSSHCDTTSSIEGNNSNPGITSSRNIKDQRFLNNLPTTDVETKQSYITAGSSSSKTSIERRSTDSDHDLVSAMTGVDSKSSTITYSPSLERLPTPSPPPASATTTALLPPLPPSPPPPPPPPRQPTRTPQSSPSPPTPLPPPATTTSSLPPPPPPSSSPQTTTTSALQQHPYDALFRHIVLCPPVYRSFPSPSPLDSRVFPDSNSTTQEQPSTLSLRSCNNASSTTLPWNVHSPSSTTQPTPYRDNIISTPSSSTTAAYHVTMPPCPRRVNLDTTSLITLVSNVTHGHCHLVFREKVLASQATEERQDPCLPALEAYLKGKELFACQTAVDSFQTILDVLGGPQEKERAARLLSGVTVVPDQPSTRAHRLETQGKIKHRSKIVFGTGDSLKAVTVTSNTGFVRAARHQGVEFSVFTHPARALTEEKETTATPL